MQPIFLSLLLTVIPVAPGANLQTALDAAQPGDEIVLQAGATYTGPLTLGPKTGSGEIIIRSSAADAMTAGTRATPAHAALMPNDSATPAGTILPHYAMGGQWATEFSVVNRSAAAIAGKIELFDTAGNPALATLNGVTSSTFRYFLPPGGSMLLAPRDGNGMSAF